MDNGWISMKERKPTEEDAIMDAGGDMAVETLQRHSHGFYPVITSIKEIDIDDDAGLSWKYYPYWRPIPPMPADLKPWHDYYMGEGERPK